DALADGTWTAVWPRVTAFAPLAAFAAGLLSPLFLPGMYLIYSESLWFMALVIAGAVLSGPVGVMLLVGYICGDLLGGGDRGAVYYFEDESQGILRKGGALLISYLLLAMPALKGPQLARRMAEGLALRVRSHPAIAVALRAGVYAVACALMVFLWC